MTGTRLIAIVEDDDSLREALAGLMDCLGHSAVTFASAEAFLAADLVPDCVVSDINLPGISGLELKQALDAAGRTAPVILITARPEAAALKQEEIGGVLCVLQKPFTLTTMVDCLEVAFSAPKKPA